MNRFYYCLVVILAAIAAKAQAPTSGYLIKVHEATAVHLDTISGTEEGLLIYNTDSNRLYYHTGTNWQSVGSDKSSTNELITSFELANDTLYLTERDTVFKVKIGSSQPQVLTSSPTVTWDVDDGVNASLTLTSASTALSMSNVTAGCYGTIVVTQDGTGGRLITFATGVNKFIHGNDNPLTLTPNAVDILSFYYDGSTYYWTYGNNFN